MKCLQLYGSRQSPSLELSERPIPEPTTGEILVRVRAAGLMPSELEWYPTWHTREGPERRQAIPSHEFAGEVAALGPSVTGFSAGDAVFGMNDWFEEGAMAEYCLSRPEWLAPSPRNLSAAEAASVPISALTAWQALFDRGRLSAGETVLIHGGAGAVGSTAIQLARNSQARVIATASAHNSSFVRELGAYKVIDYKAQPFETQAEPVDLVLDTIGGDTLERSWSVLKPNGRLVTVATASESATDERTREAFLLVQIRDDQLRHLSELVEKGALRPLVSRSILLTEAADAYLGRIRGNGRGKVVVTLD